MKLKLLEKKEEARGTFSFFWESEKKVEYLPGQYFYFTLPDLNYPDPRGSTRHFTISSSPTERGVFRFTTRIREQSGYKKSLAELETDSIIDGEGPNGTFIFDEKEKGSHVFLAGGIGITPFKSMIKYAFDKKLGTQIHLVYSNSVPEEIAFKSEFTQIANSWPSFKMDLTVTKPEESKEKWNGMVGRIDEKLLTNLVDDIPSSTFWLCGPPSMVDAMEKVLGSLKVGLGKVRSEKFTGY